MLTERSGERFHRLDAAAHDLMAPVGAVTLQASQPENANYLSAPSVQQQFQVLATALHIDAVLNVASYSAGALAPNSFATVFGTDLASLASGTGMLGTTLGGASVQITDAMGKHGNAFLYFASPGQNNLILPDNLSPRAGTMTVGSQTGPSVTAQITIAAVNPGLFSADASGTGVAAGRDLLVSADATSDKLCPRCFLSRSEPRCKRGAMASPPILSP